MPSTPPRNEDRLGDSATGAVESPAADEASKESSVAGTGECLDVVDLFFRRAFADYLCMFQIRRLRTSRRVLQLLLELI